MTEPVSNRRGDLEWKHASSCSTNGCIEIARDDRQIYLRDSAQSEVAPMRFSQTDWEDFVAAIKAGEFDGH
jgi:hypothetical protein